MLQRLKKEPLIVATHNAGKLLEFQELLHPFGLSLLSAKDLALDEPEETGTSFEENAAIKALAAARSTGYLALSDDSGLEIDALEGQPGIYTAAWAIKPNGERDFCWAMEKVEQALQKCCAIEKEQRSAQFVCVLCLATPEGEKIFFNGSVKGHLVWPPRGNRGFGYDAIFQPEGHKETFGELSATQKHGWRLGQEQALSHRAQAFKKFAHALLIADNGGV